MEDANQYGVIIFFPFKFQGVKDKQEKDFNLSFPLQYDNPLH